MNEQDRKLVESVTAQVTDDTITTLQTALRYRREMRDRSAQELELLTATVESLERQLVEHCVGINEELNLFEENLDTLRVGRQIR